MYASQRHETLLGDGTRAGFLIGGCWMPYKLCQLSVCRCVLVLGACQLFVGFGCLPTLCVGVGCLPSLCVCWCCVLANCLCVCWCWVIAKSVCVGVGCLPSLCVCVCVGVVCLPTVCVLS